MTNKPDILEMIDGAVRDWSVSNDAMRCGSSLVRRVPPSIIAVDPGVVVTGLKFQEMTPEQREAQLEMVQAMIQRIAEGVSQAVAEISGVIGDICTRLAASVEPLIRTEIVPPPEPEAVMARALMAVRNRNTGPVELPRVPRRIDPARGFR